MTAPARHSPADAARPPDRLYGLVRLGNLHAAIPIDAIREVVPRPAELLPFPATMPRIIGAIEVRGAVIPVLDLADLLNAGARRQTPEIIMLLRQGEQVFGVEICAICGVVALNDAMLTPMQVAGAADPLVLSGFTRDNRCGVVLDVARIAALPGLALARERPKTGDTLASGTIPMLMFNLGGFHFGLAARVIEACVPRRPITPSPVADPLWIGMLDHNGRRIGVIDTLALLGLGQCPPAPDCACVIVRMAQGGLVALRIDQVENMLRIGPDQQRPMQGFAVARPQLLTGLHEGQDLALLIDSEALQTDGAVADIAQMQEDAGGQIAPGTRDGANPADKGGARRPFLIVSIAGARFAIPLAQIDEILPAQAHNRIALPAQDNGFTGMIAHGGCAVPLYDLAHHLRLPRGADNACGFILLASAQGRRLGFALDGLAAVERTRLQTLTDPSRPAAQAGLPTHTICISDGSTCSVLDLSAVIARLADDATAAADVGAKIGF